MRSFLVSLFALLLLHPSAQGAVDFLADVLDARSTIEEEIADPEVTPIAKAWLLISLGRYTEAEELLAGGPAKEQADEKETHLLFASIHLARYEFGAAERHLAAAEEMDGDSEEAFRLRIRLLETKGDLAEVDRITKERLRRNPESAAALLGRGSLDLSLLRYDEAVEDFESALALAKRPEEGVRALAGLLGVAYKKSEFDKAAELGRRALEAGPPDAALLNALVDVLLRLSEVSEAIELAREVLLWDPWNERAHYILGNGYSTRNYTELQETYPAAFPDSLSRPRLAEARRLLASGDHETARAHILRIRRDFPGLVGPDILLGSLFWEEGKPDSALDYFAAALMICPEHGRAHNGFAKAMEMKRLRVSVHRDLYEGRFASADLPPIDRIDDLVVNYSSLSPRHRKSVALSLAPWKRFVPVLIEAGSTCYIKPLYELLSETPNQDVLRDLRIEYDSRLWDDVRGCGGFHMVTGIEDVERTIHGTYNTFLHELTHQIHYILTPEEKRRIQEAYRRAKEKEEAGEEVFVSRYQGSSVWEYFAEGMNSYQTPRRDRYDGNETVRERLVKQDPDLVRLLEEIIADTAATKYFAPALVAAAYDRVENGEREEALALLEHALERSPSDESTLCALSRVHSLLGDHDEAVSTAVRATQAHEQAAEPWLAHADAVYHKTGSRSEAIAILLRAREEVERSQRYLVELALAEAFVGRGDLRRGRESFEWVLAYQQDSPQALWGLGNAYGLAAEEEKADEYFTRALRRRNGLVELRADYARYLIRQRRFEEAEKQIHEALLLEPRNTDAETAAGLLAIYRRDWAEARERLSEALAIAPYNDLATILLAHASVASGNLRRAERMLRPILEAVEKETPPSYVFLDKKGEYRPVHTYPAEERWLLFQTASELATAEGDTAAAREFRRELDQVFR